MVQTKTDGLFIRTIDAPVIQKQLYYHGEESLFQEWMRKEGFRRYIIMADAKTNGFCVPFLKELFPEFQIADRIVIPDGEENKTLLQAEYIWQEMHRIHVTRKDLVICLGGGVLTDIAAFSCSVYKRGIPFVLIPTTLIGMVDASIGGKTAIDFLGMKNMIGSFCVARAVFIHSHFLQTLPERQLKSGIAEQIKHALLQHESQWQTVCTTTPDSFYSDEFIRYSSEWKWAFIQNDLFDNGVRQALNLGHTLGHAIEAFSLQTKHPLLHGEAIMYGLELELKLSTLHCGLPSRVYSEFVQLKNKFFPELKERFQPESLIPFLFSDKKNDEQIRMTLLHDIGQAELQIKIEIKDIIQVFE